MKSRGSVTIAAVVVFGLAVAELPASAAPQGPWVQPPANLSAIGQSGDQQQVAAAPDGTTTAVWRRDDVTGDVIQASTRSPGGSFGAPVDLSVAGEDASSPQIATAPDGTATAETRLLLTIAPPESDE